MKKQLKKITLLFAVMLMCSLLKAQDLVVSLTNGNSESFPVSDIMSIKFGASDMILNESNGTTNTWAIDDIDNYSFDGTASLSDSKLLLEVDVNVFPNPASDKVNIMFNSNIIQRISIQIIDATGKLMYTVYEGVHQDKKTYIWTPQLQGKAKTGSYFCKITTENKVITQPIIIQ
jgi:hypothetical protein